MTGLPDTLLEIWAALTSMRTVSLILLYFALYVALASHMGALGWVTVVACLAPLAYKSYKASRRRYDAYMVEISSSRKGYWDIDKALDDYVEILERQQQKRASRNSCG